MKTFRVILMIAAGAACLGAADPVQTRDDEIAALKNEIAAQQAQLEQLRNVLDRQEKALARLTDSAQANRGTSAEPKPASAPGTAAPEVAGAQALTAAQGATATVERPKPTLGGFELSGDFRFRADVQARSGNAVAGPLQNIRSRYRVRLNVDKQLDPRFKFHLQLSTGPYSVQTTNDQDMAALGTKHPFSIAEAWIAFQPNKSFSMRGGRMEEVFADNSRFLWDDDVRFNGFEQKARFNLARNKARFTDIEFRMGEYILSNPAIYVLPANSPYVAAGYPVGQKVRASNLFHPGAILRGSLSEKWTQGFTGDVQIYRNPNQIQLASTAAGYPVLINGPIGLQLSGPVGAVGNATTTPGGAMYSAPDFQIARLAYRVSRAPFEFAGRKMPAYLDFQVSRNVGANNLRDAFMFTANLGDVKNAGDVRFLYQYALKDANALISQFTDDDLGTGSGVNIAVHGMRIDIGLTRFLQWQNLLFIQNERRGNNPAEHLFVPLQRGANPTFRYLGQLAFTF